MTPGLERLGLDPDAREVLDLADGCGLRPRIGAPGPGGATTVVVDSRTPDGLFGTITIGAGGELASARLVHGNHGDERQLDGAAEVRAVIASWAALARADS